MAAPTKLGNENKVERISPKDLLLDAKNPRLVEFLEGNQKPTQDELLRVLWEEMGVNELVLSIAKSGFRPYEPLLITTEGGKNVVIEGNRRLAAIILLTDKERAAKVKATPLPKLSATAQKSLVEIPIIRTTREEAWTYLGAKHINGPKKWDSYAKAQYISEVANDHGVSLDAIAEQIGDKHKTVQRLYRALMVVEQAEKLKVFKRSNRHKKHFAFSHLYTALDYDNVAKFIGLSNEDDETQEPVDVKKKKELGELCTWLYGDKLADKPPLVESQNPHLRELVDVLGKPDAVKGLRAGLSLQAAVEISYGDSKVFEDSLVVARNSLQKANAMVTTGFNGDADLMDLATDIFELAEALIATMRRKEGRNQNSRNTRN